MSKKGKSLAGILVRLKVCSVMSFGAGQLERIEAGAPRESQSVLMSGWLSKWILGFQIFIIKKLGKWWNKSFPFLYLSENSLVCDYCNACHHKPYVAKLKSSRVPAGQRPPGQQIAINYCIVHYVLCTTGRLARKLPLARQQQDSQLTTFTHIIQTCRTSIKTTSTTSRRLSANRWSAD